jgi:hypothetical protein
VSWPGVWVTEAPGVRYEAAGPDLLEERIRTADRPGQHLWVCTAAWKVAEPESRHRVLDAENLLTVQGPGCFKCEQPYTRRIAAKPCYGSISPLPGNN